MRPGFEAVRNAFQDRRMVAAGHLLAFFPFGGAGPFAGRTPEPHYVLMTAWHGTPPIDGSILARRPLLDVAERRRLRRQTRKILASQV
jgi:hypothetical protein